MSIQTINTETGEILSTSQVARLMSAPGSGARLKSRRRQWTREDALTGRRRPTRRRKRHDVTQHLIVALAGVVAVVGYNWLT